MTHAHDDGAAAPAGYARIIHGGAYMAALGPMYRKQDSAALIIAIRLTEEHSNMRGITHGGMLASLADSTLGLALMLKSQGRNSFVTINLSTDFMAPARPGDLLESHVEVKRLGASVAFAECRLMVGSKQVLRASGVFAVLKPLDAQAALAAD